jgi:hypothetical protein
MRARANRQPTIRLTLLLVLSSLLIAILFTSAGNTGHVHGPWCSHGHVNADAATREAIARRGLSGSSATGNRGVVYAGPGKVEVRGIGYPKLEEPSGRK